MQKRSKKIQSIQDKKRNMKKETAAAREEMREIRENKYHSKKAALSSFVRQGGKE